MSKAHEVVALPMEVRVLCERQDLTNVNKARAAVLDQPARGEAVREADTITA